MKERQPKRLSREFFKIEKVCRKYDRHRQTFTFNITYRTATLITLRTIGVAEAFGLGVDEEREFPVLECELKIKPDDIVYITGDSGSGKSTLLKAIERDLSESEAVNINNTPTDLQRPLIDTVGKTFEEGLELLSRVGLNDAFLFLRRYNELSDGQKYRYRLARLVESGAQYWIADEFRSTLDRDTAKIVAFNFQKLARKMGKAIIVATTHTDLFEDLKPSVHIHKGFGKEINVKYYPNRENKQCGLLKEMQVEEGSYEDWKALARFHYRSHSVAFVKKIFVLKRKGQVCGAIVYTAPPVSASCRNRVFKPKSMKDLNEKLTRISRVVVHPKYRTIGAGAKLVHDSLPLCGKPYVEMIAVMARYNPFAERAGMKKICETKPNRLILDAVAELEKLGFTPYLLAVPEHNRRMLKGRVPQVKNILSSFRFPYTRRIAGQSTHFTSEDYRKWLKKARKDELARALTRLAQLSQSKVYLFWKRSRA